MFAKLGAMIGSMAGLRTLIVSAVTFFMPILVAQGVFGAETGELIKQWVVANLETVISTLGLIFGLLRLVTNKEAKPVAAIKRLMGPDTSA